MDMQLGMKHEIGKDMDEEVELQWMSRGSRVSRDEEEERYQECSDKQDPLRGIWLRINRIPETIHNMSPYGVYIPPLYILFAMVLLIWVYSVILFERPMISHEIPVMQLSCGRAEQIWEGFDTECGLHAEKCLLPFKRHKTLYVKCPAFCEGSGLVYNVLRYKDVEIQYEPFIVTSPVEENGEIVYRGDSYPCMAAYREGLVGNMWGGTVKLELTDRYPYDVNLQNDEKMVFNGWYPAGFVIKPLERDEKGNNLFDLISLVIWLGVFLSVGLGVFVVRNDIFWFSSVMLVYLSIVLVVDPPIVVDYEDNITLGDNSSWQLLSVVIGRLLPLSGIIVLIWVVVCEYSFVGSGLIQRLTFLCGLWITGMDALTFEKLPIDRLVIEDVINMGASGILAFIFVMILIVFCCVLQLYRIWRDGWFLKCVSRYLIVIFTVVALGVLFGDRLVLRVHHWVIGLFFIWGCKSRGSIAGGLQGLCVGLILAGVGRWGFASIFERGWVVDRDGDNGDRPTAPSVPVFVYNAARHQLTIEPVDDDTEINVFGNDVWIYKGHGGEDIPIEDIQWLRGRACNDGGCSEWVWITK